MRVSLWPRFFATNNNGMPFITAWLAHVWRVVWKPHGKAIFPFPTASVIGRF